MTICSTTNKFQLCAKLFILLEPPVHEFSLGKVVQFFAQFFQRGITLYEAWLYHDVVRLTSGSGWDVRHLPSSLPVCPHVSRRDKLWSHQPKLVIEVYPGSVIYQKFLPEYNDYYTKYIAWLIINTKLVTEVNPGSTIYQKSLPYYNDYYTKYII